MLDCNKWTADYILRENQLKNAIQVYRAMPYIKRSFVEAVHDAVCERKKEEVCINSGTDTNKKVFLELWKKNWRLKKSEDDGLYIYFECDKAWPSERNTRVGIGRWHGGELVKLARNNKQRQKVREAFGSAIGERLNVVVCGDGDEKGFYSTYTEKFYEESDIVKRMAEELVRLVDEMDSVLEETAGNAGEDAEEDDG